MFHQIVRSKTVGLAMTLIIAIIFAITFAAVSVEAGGPAPAQKAQMPTKDMAGVKANVTTAVDLTAETAAKVKEDKEMSAYSTVFLEKNPELAAVMAAKVIAQQRAAPNVASSVLPGGERWMTVADPLGRDFQLAYHYFLHQDYPAAAIKIREGANFLQAEETALEQEVPEAGFAKDLALRSAIIDQLNGLADRVAQGQASIKDLDAAVSKAYQVDLEHGVSKLQLEERAISAL